MPPLSPHTSGKVLAITALAAAFFVGERDAAARPPGVQIFCDTYAESPLCTRQEASCSTCHTAPPTLNVYGDDVLVGIVALDGVEGEEAFTAALPMSLQRVEQLDSDGDGVLNLDEIELGFDPGDEVSVPSDDVSCQEGSPGQDAYAVCAFDERLVYKRVKLDVCGRSPSVEEWRAFEEASDRMAFIDEALDGCLDSDFWVGQEGQLWQLSYPKVRPRLPFAAARIFDADFNLFVYSQTDDRDARDLLVADYYVSRDDSSTPPRYTADDAESPRRTQRNRRAGMLTQQWFHASNTMGQVIPRVAAAQAYRAYLGYDLSIPEGIFPTPGPLIDYDSKGVDAEECAVCHTTLDPLAYMFSRYSGTGEPPEAPRFQRDTPGRYTPERLEYFVGRDGTALILDTPEQGALFGEPVADLVQWANLASSSDAFARHLVADYWELFIGHRPRAEEGDEFEQLWRAFMTTHDYRVERMLHALIRTEAYGVP